MKMSEIFKWNSDTCLSVRNLCRLEGIEVPHYLHQPLTRTWQIWLEGQLIDTITTDGDMSAEGLKRALVKDGYQKDIEVRISS